MKYNNFHVLMGGIKVGRKALRPLTARQVASEKKLGYIADGDQPGLNLQVTQGAHGLSRSWVFRYTSPLTLKRRELGLGSVSDVSLSQARSEVAELKLLVRSGVDPKQRREQEIRARKLAHMSKLTFEQAAEKCIATKKHEWKNAKHESQWTTTLTTYVYPDLGPMLVDDITTDHVLKVLEPIWITKTETATRVRQRIESVLDWCKARKLITGENPASLKGGLRELLPKASKIKKVEHHPAVPYAKASAFICALRHEKGMSAKALEFTMLTAARSGEVLGARWDEFDITGAVWTIPAARMKAGREHRIPLCLRAIEIVKALVPLTGTKTSNFVFPGAKPSKGLSSASLLAVMRRMPEFASYVPHGLRSTFRDWAAEVTNVPNETLELALAHSIKNQTEAAYRRGDQLDKRFELMQQWQDFLESELGYKTPASLPTLEQHDEAIQ